MMTEFMHDPDERKFDRNSWLVLILALVILAFSWTSILWPASLPSDGWSYLIDLSKRDESLTVDAKVGSWASPLAPGDVVLAVEGQPASTIVARAFALAPQRPPNWTAGGSVVYTVRRAGQIINLDVPIAHYSASDLLGNLLSGGSGTSGLLIIFLPLMGLLGVLVFLRRPRYAPARLLLLFAVSVLGGFVELAPSGLSDLLYPLAYFLYDQPVFISFWQITILPVILHLLLIFPTVKRPLRRRPLFSLFIIYVPTQAALWLTFLLFRTQPATFQAVYLRILSIQALAIAFASGIALAHSFWTIREPVGRAQLQWVAVGILGGFLLGALSWLVGEWVGQSLLISLISVLGFILMPICLSVAILRYRLFDIAILINRALVYGMLTAILAVVFFGSVVVLQSLLAVVTGAPNTSLVTVLSTLAIAALFTPLRHRLQAIIDRRFYRHKYDAARALQSFASGARDQVELNSLADRLLAVVDDTLRPEHSSLWLKSEAQLSSDSGHD
ncbi:MAG: hypothetical protein ABI847_14235 [Anaerolineales bacterium]